MKPFLSIKKQSGLPDIWGMRHIACGDSITVGNAASPISLSWVNRIKSTFNLTTTVNLGVGGASLSNIEPQTYHKNGQEILADIPNYDGNTFITYAYGVNECYGRSVSVDQWTEAYTNVFNALKAKGYPMKNFFVLDIYYFTGSTGMTDAKIRSFNSVIQNLCSLNKANYIPNRQYCIDRFEAMDISPDTVHPTSQGHGKIFNCFCLYVKPPRV